MAEQIEVSKEEAGYEDLMKARVASEKSELRWKRAKRAFFGAMAVWGAGVYFFMVGHNWGWWDSSEDKVAPVVRIEGGIGAGSENGSADAVIGHLKTAFKDKKAAAVVLYIDSPGGSPAEAERINRVIDEQKAETGKPIYAVCGNLCASAGYMIAMHADEVYAGRYSLVGSIGAILSTWNFSEAINKFGVQHHAYASGKLKAMLNPYIPVKSEDSAKAQALVAGMGKVFSAEVEQRRGNKLAKGANLFTGEVWNGEDAKGYGLVDGIATLDEVIQQKFGKDVKTKDINKSSQKIPFLQTAIDSFAKRLVAAATDQAAMSLK